MNNKKETKKAQPIYLMISGDKITDLKTDAIFNGCLFVNFGGRVYYFDNSTGEVITDQWKDRFTVN